MSTKRITESKPRSGANAVDGIANSNGGSVNHGDANAHEMLAGEKQIYDIVEQDVRFAGEQFSENLRFNGEVLTNVLYENIYKILGDEFEEDKFVEYVANELISRGCVILEHNDEKENVDETSPQHPNETVVTELDTKEYEDLVQRVYATIDLVKASRLSLFKAFASVNEQIGQLSDCNQNSIEQERKISL